MHLELLPPVRGLSFEERGHVYRWIDARHGALHPPSVSRINQAAGLKTMDRRWWRRRLVKDGATEAEANALHLEPLQPLTYDQAEWVMDQWTDLRRVIGIQFHAMVSAEILSTPHLRPADCHPEAEACFSAWREEFLPRIGAVFACEAPQMQEDYFVTGTPDLCAEVDGVVRLADWKTFAPKPTEDGGIHEPKVRADWIYQSAAYVWMLESRYGIKIENAMNYMISTELRRDKFWTRGKLDEAATRFRVSALDYLVIQSRLGCVGSSLTLYRHHYGIPSRQSMANVGAAA